MRSPCIILHLSVCSRGYKRGEREREGCSQVSRGDVVGLLCAQVYVNSYLLCFFLVLGMDPAFSFYSYKESQEIHVYMLCCYYRTQS